MIFYVAVAQIYPWKRLKFLMDLWSWFMLTAIHQQSWNKRNCLQHHYKRIQSDLHAFPACIHIHRRISPLSNLAVIVSSVSIACGSTHFIWLTRSTSTPQTFGLALMHYAYVGATFMCTIFKYFQISLPHSLICYQLAHTTT